MTERVERIVTRAIIQDDEGRVLLGKRASGVGEGQWALVGGKPDPNEDLAKTVVREVFEELGVDFTPTFYKEELDVSTDPERPWKVYFYTGSMQGVLEMNLDEISEVAYVSQEELADYDIAFDHRERLEEFFKNE